MRSAGWRYREKIYPRAAFVRVLWGPFAVFDLHAQSLGGVKRRQVNEVNLVSLLFRVLGWRARRPGLRAVALSPKRGHPRDQPMVRVRTAGSHWSSAAPAVSGQSARA